MIRYKLFLKPEERDLLTIAVRKYKSTAQKYIYSQILLHSDENTPTEKLSASALRERYGISCKTVERVRRSFCANGMAIFEPQVRKVRSDKKYDARVEAHLIALCCQQPPNDKPEWTLKLLCESLVELHVLESASCSSVCNLLKKTNLSPFKENNM